MASISSILRFSTSFDVFKMSSRLDMSSMLATATATARTSLMLPFTETRNSPQIKSHPDDGLAASAARVMQKRDNFYARDQQYTTHHVLKTRDIMRDYYTSSWSSKLEEILERDFDSRGFQKEKNVSSLSGCSKSVLKLNLFSLISLSNISPNHMKERIKWPLFMVKP